MQSADLQPSGEKPPDRGPNILLALGANLTSSVGPPEKTLRSALDLLAEEGAVIRAVSRFFSTPAYPPGNGPDYVNAAAAIEAPWSVAETLAQLHGIEARMERSRDVRWGQRTLDLDLLAMGDQVVPDAQTHRIWRELDAEAQRSRAPDQPIVPHPRLQDRGFVLVPLADVAPEWRHPLLGLTVRQMLDALAEDAKKDIVALQ